MLLITLFIICENTKSLSHMVVLYFFTHMVVFYFTYGSLIFCYTHSILGKTF